MNKALNSSSFKFDKNQMIATIDKIGMAKPKGILKLETLIFCFTNRNFIVDKTTAK